MANGSPPASGRPLACLGGVELSLPLQQDLRLMLQVSPPVDGNFWMMVSAAIRDSPPEAVAQHVAAFCRERSLEPRSIDRTLHAYRFLLREAAHRNVTVDDFNNDLATIADNEEDGLQLQSLLGSGFAAMMRQLREEMVSGAVTDHGKTLLDVSWRVDSMLASDRGDTQQKRLGVITLRYLEGQREERITFNVQPQVLAALHRAAEKMLSVD
ncbi:MAG: hypothetical protein AAGA56_24265 [Myxococcota bacterium]